MSLTLLQMLILWTISLFLLGAAQGKQHLGSDKACGGGGGADFPTVLGKVVEQPGRMGSAAEVG